VLGIAVAVLALILIGHSGRHALSAPETGAAQELADSIVELCARRAGIRADARRQALTPEQFARLSACVDRERAGYRR
jgi:hypothetical protein